MNWLDWLVVIVLAVAAFKGFSRGFIVELASLLALILGIWAGIHLSDRVADAIGLETKSAAVAFMVTFLIVLVGVHLIARFLTKMIDIAQLSLPNKATGVVFGVVRSAFSLSIALNLLAGYSRQELPPKEIVDGSSLHGPVKSFAPILIPALNETKWLKRAMEDLKDEVNKLSTE